ncbi:Antitoxin [Hyphomicrobiales bacterium]|nr:Antitoxin [Hyphomicrobiales bacterium]CAH1692496.1 Antitoxin [Hyphomicrobiales bacterium]
MEWSLQDAKNQFSRVVQQARHEGPQSVTLRGIPAAVVLSAADFEALRAGHPTLVDDLLGGPAWDDELAIAILRDDPASDGAPHVSP